MGDTIYRVHQRSKSATLHNEKFFLDWYIRKQKLKPTFLREEY